jgi:hypothetical protein
MLITVGRVAQSVLATSYGLEGPGIESGWRRDFPHLSRSALGPTQPPVQWVTDLSRRLRAAGLCCWSLTTFYYRGHGRVELYFYRPSGPHRALNGVTLPFTFFITCYLLSFIRVSCRRPTAVAQWLRYCATVGDRGSTVVKVLRYRRGPR